MKKTTIAISPMSRKKLEEIKRHLEQPHIRGHFVDMDEVVAYLLENI